MLMDWANVTEKFSSLGLGQDPARSRTPRGKTRLYKLLNVRNRRN